MRALLFALAFAWTACAARPVVADPPGQSGPFRVELIDGRGSLLPTFERAGRTYVLGQHGDRYRVRIANPTSQRVEVVVSVDGRDAVDGGPARFEKAGYVLPPWGEVVVDGFRLSMRDVAAFRFSTVAGSYAALRGHARDVGVIGVAVFRELAPPPPRPVLRRPSSEPPYNESRDQRSSAGKGDGAAAAPSAQGSRSRSADEDRPGLGTGFGERRYNPVTTVQFRRARATPDYVLAVRYDDHDGLLALGIDVDRRGPDRRETWRRETARPFSNLPAFAPPPQGWEDARAPCRLEER
jgi:hypothetical protein